METSPPYRFFYLSADNHFRVRARDGEGF